MHARTHAYSIRYITLRYVTLRYITLFTLYTLIRYITLHTHIYIYKAVCNRTLKNTHTYRHFYAEKKLGLNHPVARANNQNLAETTHHPPKLKPKSWADRGFPEQVAPYLQDGTQNAQKAAARALQTTHLKRKAREKGRRKRKTKSEVRRRRDFKPGPQK